MVEKWTYILPEKVLRYINNLETQLAAKDRQLEAAAEDVKDMATRHGCDVICPMHEDCGADYDNDCADMWRIRWEGAAK